MRNFILSLLILTSGCLIPDLEKEGVGILVINEYHEANVRISFVVEGKTYFLENHSSNLEKVGESSEKEIYRFTVSPGDVLEYSVYVESYGPHSLGPFRTEVPAKVKSLNLTLGFDFPTGKHTVKADWVDTEGSRLGPINTTIGKMHSRTIVVKHDYIGNIDGTEGSDTGYPSVDLTVKIGNDKFELTAADNNYVYVGEVLTREGEARTVTIDSKTHSGYNITGSAQLPDGSEGIYMSLAFTGELTWDVNFN